MEFDLQPSLRGSLIELRPLRQEDFEPLFQAASDPLIWEQHPEPDRYQRAVFQTFFDGAIESKGAFVVLDRKSGKIIGSSRYHDYNPAKSEVEIGWTFLERAYWGGIYNRELKSLMIDSPPGSVACTRTVCDEFCSKSISSPEATIRWPVLSIAKRPPASLMSV